MLLVWTGPFSGRCRGESWVACTLRCRPGLSAAAPGCKISEPFALWDWRKIFWNNKVLFYHVKSSASVTSILLNFNWKSKKTDKPPGCLVHGSRSPGLRIGQIQNLFPVWERWYYFKSLWQLSAAVPWQNLTEKKNLWIQFQLFLHFTHIPK